ncbi:YjgF-like protein [Gonapodya prolifera JEL478]|uniref:YjgF-like protein n=1 Tax=Gonapodya prolifera (strain JEL478) TaxID=1344416 RepID=A0A139AXD9_GONPJ|nr:YjgF-like protein [Gonapodya prolifera JEL478]|eukprot:KXS21243.1 YjgF-like protein [Gonapodya prolifera JEL478]
MQHFARTPSAIPSLLRTLMTHKDLTPVFPAGAKPLAPYTPGIKAGGFLFVSGQLGIVDGKLVEGVEEQTRVALENLKTVVEAGGSSIDKICKITVFLNDINDFAKMNGVYGKFFDNHKPARSAFQVGKLPLDGLVEIEAIVLA